MENKNFSSFVVVGVSLIIASSIFSFVFYKVRVLDNTISVVGSAKEKVVSDTIKWRANLQVFEVPQTNLGPGYKKLSSDLEEVKKFFKENGYPEDKLVIQPPFIETLWCGNAQCPNVNIKQEIILNSNEISKIQELEKKSRELLKKGANFTTTALEYYYSKLPELRIKLLKQAMEDAQNRAKSILEISDKKLGGLKSVSSGVVQVLAPNSVDISDYGTYDTSTLEKEVMITVRATFFLK